MHFLRMLFKLWTCIIAFGLAPFLNITGILSPPLVLSAVVGVRLNRYTFLAGLSSSPSSLVEKSSSSNHCHLLQS
ncbi:hypothetical protein VNO77_04736 [Canavalia gladiata]|uniref:Uncharacterized protein n=1 Tax=Canavalia gladiata TaxID=3824 RepID=A0AAN9N3K3_CANGL